MLAFEPPPSSALPDPLPGLPCQRREPLWSSDTFTLSTHIIPAAYYRSSGEVQLPETPPNDANLSKETRSKIASTSEAILRELRIQQDLRTMKYGLQAHPRLLWICLNRYVRKDLDPRRKGITLFCAHANGLHKETWEPTLSYLLSSPAGDYIDEVWAWDAIHHGDSGRLNAGNLNSLFHWNDGANDLLNFLVYYLPTRPTSAPLPLHLKKVDAEESKTRLSTGFSYGSRGRTLVGVGHSFGGGATVIAAHAYPALFLTLILIDAIVYKPRWDPSTTPSPEEGRVTLNMTTPNALTLGALIRKSSWPSREDARKRFSSPFFKAWNPAVLEQYIQNALYDDPAVGVVRLKMAPIHEALMFSETFTGAEPAWLLVPTLDEKVEIRWILPDESKPVAGEPGTDVLRVQLRPKNASHARISGAGHLIVQEAPRALAQEIGDFLSMKYPMVHKQARL